MRRSVLVILGISSVLAIAVAIAAGLVLEHTRSKSSTPATTTPARIFTPTSTSSQSSAPTPTPTDMQLLAEIDTFAKGYGSYLNGGRATDMNSSVTAEAEATQQGRIAAVFRDGPLHVKQLNTLESTCCSASVTVVLANREETYPFAEQLLYEGGRWLVDQITPADLPMDRHLKAPTNVTDPAGGQAAAKRFAIAYVNYKSGISSTPPAMTAAASAEITQGTDSLAGQRLPKTPARLTGMRFGPATGSEFAVTATVTAGATTQTFSFLMTKTPGGWKCEQFL